MEKDIKKNQLKNNKILHSLFNAALFIYYFILK